MRGIYQELPIGLLAASGAMALSYVWDEVKRELQWRKCVKAAKQGK